MPDSARRRRAHVGADGGGENAERIGKDIGHDNIILAATGWPNRQTAR